MKNILMKFNRTHLFILVAMIAIIEFGLIVRPPEFLKEERVIIQACYDPYAKKRLPMEPFSDQRPGQHDPAKGREYKWK